MGQVYLDWAQYPLLETERLEGDTPGYVVRFRDLRFMYPDSRRRALVAYVLLSPSLQVEAASFRRRQRLQTGLESGSPFGGEEE